MFITADDRKEITKKLAESLSAIDISKGLKRDPKTAEEAINDIHFVRKVRSDKSKKMFLTSRYEKIIV